MKAYAEALNCPGWPAPVDKLKKNIGPVGPIGEDRISIFDVDDILVALVEQNGHSFPIFGMVQNISAKHGLEIKMLKHDDFDLTEFLTQAYAQNYEFSAEDLFSVETDFAIVPKGKFAENRPIIKADLDGLWRSSNVYFDFYDEREYYMRYYSVRDMKKVMKRLRPNHPD